MKIAQLLLVSLTLLLFSGCCKQPETPQVIYVPQKCKIPKIDKPVVDNAPYISNSDIIAKALSNYVKMKEYSDKLLEAQNVCE